jgi:hypothetical protein
MQQSVKATDYRLVAVILQSCCSGGRAPDFAGIVTVDRNNADKNR